MHVDCCHNFSFLAIHSGFFGILSINITLASTNNSIHIMSFVEAIRVLQQLASFQEVVNKIASQSGSGKCLRAECCNVGTNFHLTASLFNLHSLVIMQEETPTTLRRLPLPTSHRSSAISTGALLTYLPPRTRQKVNNKPLTRMVLQTQTSQARPGARPRIIKDRQARMRALLS